MSPAADPVAHVIDVRRATAADALFLAEMIDLSNAGADRANFDVALANVLVPGSDVGFGNAVIVEVGNTPAAAMVVNAPLHDPIDLSRVKPEHLPYETLKAQVPGMLYLRNIAVLPQMRGMGLASILVDLALNMTMDMARMCKATGLCALVHRRNEPMRRRMLAKGLTVAASGFLPVHPHFPHGVELDLWTVTLAR